MSEILSDKKPVILVVDDNAINLQVVGAILEEAVDCELVFVSSGQQALRAMKEWQPVLVLLDIMMPGLDGYEVCKRLKADPETADTPVIYITAKTEEQDILMGFATGAVDYITKPFRADELLARVRTHLGLAMATRQIKAQAAEIRQSEIWFKALFRESPVSILIHDKDTGAIIDANPQAYQAYGFSSLEDLQNTHFWTDPPYSQADAMAWMQRSLQEGPQFFEWMNQTAGGQVFWERVCLRPIQLDGVERILVVGVDITERKQLEAERELMQIKLMQTGRLEAVGQLAAGIAHEINNPVQFIGDNTTFVRDALPDLLNLAECVKASLQEHVDGTALVESLQTALANIDLEFLREEIPQALAQSLDGVQRVKRIVNAMREFAHPDSEERVLVDLNACVRNSAAITRSVWEPIAEMTLQLSDDLPPVNGFTGAINQVLTNIIINAAHAIEESRETGPGQIVIRTLASAGHVEIRIQDTGGGIPPDIQSRVFDPFFTTKEIGKGTGQGLSLARNIIAKDHGGQIEFESEPGKGTTFVVRLPTSGAGQ